MANIAKQLVAGQAIKVAMNGSFQTRTLKDTCIVNFNAVDPQYRKFPAEEAVYQLGKSWDAYNQTFALVAVPVVAVRAAAEVKSNRSIKCDADGNIIA